MKAQYAPAATTETLLYGCKIGEPNYMEEIKLFKVVGHKNGQLVEISELPMSEENCWKWIKKQGIDKTYYNPVPVPYHGNKPEFKHI